MGTARTDRAAEMSVGEYLDRIGIQRAEDTSLEMLARLQAAHVRSVPFENLSIVGDPYGSYSGERIELQIDQLYQKIVEDGRGGYCFELNGPFSWLLEELGYDVDRVAARVVSGNAGTVPANHLALVVNLDQRYVVDVGIGLPKFDRPVPIGGESIESIREQWRVMPADRPDEDYVVQYRDADEGWIGHYVFTDRPQDLQYFAATNDYLQSSPTSPFTQDPVVNIATERGYIKGSHEQLVIDEEGRGREEQPLDAERWSEVLAQRFSLRLPGSNE